MLHLTLLDDLYKKPASDTSDSSILQKTNNLVLPVYPV